MILYEGPSQLTGDPIVLIATGANGTSLNHKTGPMVQTYILRRDLPPGDAIRSGQDNAICGECPLRGFVTTIANGEQVNRNRGCYVFVDQSIHTVWQAYRDGQYEPAHVDDLAGEFIRFGSYGDPVAVPLAIWALLADVSSGWTGYTHQWRLPISAEYRRFLMASVESDADAGLARTAGWRTFRVARAGEPLSPGEFQCPASAEENHRKTCSQCRACDGARAQDQRASVRIFAHGPKAAQGAMKRLFNGESLETTWHRTKPSTSDLKALDALERIGPASASQLAAELKDRTNPVAARLWHLRQIGLVTRVSRGIYQRSSP